MYFPPPHERQQEQDFIFAVKSEAVFLSLLCPHLLDTEQNAVDFRKPPIRKVFYITYATMLRKFLHSQLP